MALGEPIQELILREIKSRLEGINATSAPDTYYNRVRRVVRGLINPDQDVGALTLQLSSVNNAVKQYQSGGGAGGVCYRVMTVAVDAWLHKEFLSDTDSIRLAADIERAVMSDRKNGGHSECTWWQGAAPMAAPDEAAPTAYLRVQFTVEYRTAAGLPATPVGG